MKRQCIGIHIFLEITSKIIFAISRFDAKGTDITSSSTIKTSLLSDPKWQSFLEISFAMTKSVPACSICFLAQEIMSSFEMLNSALKPTKNISGLTF